MRDNLWSLQSNERVNARVSFRGRGNPLDYDDAPAAETQAATLPQLITGPSRLFDPIADRFYQVLIGYSWLAEILQSVRLLAQVSPFDKRTCCPSHDVTLQP